MSEVRVRFAPSPTGPLHIGGVRTALYNYLFARSQGGKFILRVEDTDQNRYVEGAENYIVDALKWFGLLPDEGPGFGGDFGPYRQSERKEIYAKYAMQMVEQGHAYYAWDTPDDLDKMRSEDANAKYDANTRKRMVNSLSLTPEESAQKLADNTPYVIRLKMPEDETVSFTDLVRGDVSFQTNNLDDKVILKGDGMPTYHLANIVDDHLMKISHVIRGEEWLSSTPHHVIMYRFLNWDAPAFTHLPLILKPTGKGKLSKRDGAKFGIPVFPLEWNPGDGEDVYTGFREEGFLSSAVLNFLAFLGWNPGTEQEIFSVKELISEFTIDRIVKSGARFDFDKAKWYNQQYIIASSDELLAEMLNDKVEGDVTDMYLRGVCHLMKERVERVEEILTEGSFFFSRPTEYDGKTIKKKYKPENRTHFEAIIGQVEQANPYSSDQLQSIVKTYVGDNELSFGAIFPILRIIVSGVMKGPDLFQTMELLGREEVLIRMKDGLNKIHELHTQL